MGIAGYAPPADGQFPADDVVTIDPASLEWETTPLPTDTITEDYLATLSGVGADQEFVVLVHDQHLAGPLDGRFDRRPIEWTGWRYATVDDAGLAAVFGPDARPQAVVVANDQIIVVGTLHDGWTDPAVWVAHLPDRSSGR